MYNFGSSRRSARAVARSEVDQQGSALCCFSFWVAHPRGKAEGLPVDVDDIGAPSLDWVDPFAIESCQDESAILCSEV